MEMIGSRTGSLETSFRRFTRNALDGGAGAAERLVLSGAGRVIVNENFRNYPLARGHQPLCSLPGASNVALLKMARESLRGGCEIAQKQKRR
jgi:hypothetical protein